MMPSLLRFAVLGGTIALFGLMVVAMDAPSSARDDESRKKEGQAVYREPLSAQNCAGCHGGLLEIIRGYSQPDRNGYTSSKFVRLDEYHIWQTQDLHSQAFKNITPDPKGGTRHEGNLAWKMQRILEQDKRRNAVPGGKYQVDKAGECLACHAVDLSWDYTTARSKPIDLSTTNNDTRFLTPQGVSCEACHGIADKWFAPHLKTSWREVDVDKKLKEFGELDLRSPGVRAERCASCHIGNKAEGKFVTHEMYAAGHPPLPAFELVTYVRDQPSHCFSRRNNTDLALMAAKDVTGTSRNFHFRKGELTEVKSLVVGTIAAFRSQMNLLAATEQEKDRQAPTGELLDFAHFDCMACHHDLKYPSDRQNRVKGIPGRPAMKVSTELVKVVLKHACSITTEKSILGSEFRNKFEVQLDELRNAFDSRPFGDNERIKKAAVDLTGLCTQMFELLETMEYTEQFAKGLSEELRSHLRRLAEKPKEGERRSYLDHDSAQQFVWALLALQKELREYDDTEAFRVARARLAEIIPLSLREPEAVSNSITNLLQDILGRTGITMQFEPLYIPFSVENRLKARLEKQYNFEAEPFFDALRDLLDQLPAKK